MQRIAAFGAETLGVDGSFFKADTSKESIYTADQLDKQLRQLEQKINTYQEQLAPKDEADNQAELGSLVEDQQLGEKIAALKEKQATKKALQKQFAYSGPTWRRSNRITLSNLLHNPIYAGACAYGRRPTDPRKKIPGRPSTGRTVAGINDWEVLIKDHH